VFCDRKGCWGRATDSVSGPGNRLCGDKEGVGRYKRGGRPRWLWVWLLQEKSVWGRGCCGKVAAINSHAGLVHTGEARPMSPGHLRFFHSRASCSKNSPVCSWSSCKLAQQSREAHTLGSLQMRQWLYITCGCNTMAIMSVTCSWTTGAMHDLHVHGRMEAWMHRRHTWLHTCMAEHNKPSILQQQP
jgi:hypothetical protein